MKFDRTTATTLAMLALLLAIAVGGHYLSPLLLPGRCFLPLLFAADFLVTDFFLVVLVAMRAS